MKIDMDPPYQRRGRLWSESDKAYLIDSILNDFDVPKIYLADFTYVDSVLNRKRLPYAIIDGKQRFEAIFDFYEGKITLNGDFVFRADTSLKLGGLGYTDLVSNYPEIAETFDQFHLSVMSVITDDEKLINELFVRLNRSKPLTGAEIRNAMSGPAPKVTRKMVEHAFFKDYISFTVKRGQDLNAAMKLLLFEFSERPQETKKSNLDEFVKFAASKRSHLELSARRVFAGLDDLTSIFLPRDKLLSSSGILPVYYWFIRGIQPKQYPSVREFIARFEEQRRTNRRQAESGGGRSRIDRPFVEYDQLNRNTNDLSSHIGRVEILRSKFQEFKG